MQKSFFALLLYFSEQFNALGAAAQGASNTIELVLGIAANLIAFLAFLKFLNEVIAWMIILLGYTYKALLDESMVVSIHHRQIIY